MKDYDYKPMSTLALSGLWRLRIIAVLRYVDPCLGPPCRVMRPFSAECRPKCISVIAWGARFWECSTPSIGFNLCENCYNPVFALAVGLMEIEK